MTSDAAKAKKKERDKARKLRQKSNKLAAAEQLQSNTTQVHPTIIIAKNSEDKILKNSSVFDNSGSPRSTSTPVKNEESLFIPLKAVTASMRAYNIIAPLYGHANLWGLIAFETAAVVALNYGS